jgi:hypothetical protein
LTICHEDGERNLKNPDAPDPRELHGSIDFIGLRAHATSVGLIQLCAELMEAGVLDGAAIQRIKDAIHREITISNPRGKARGEFDQALKERLDAIFPKAAEPQDRADVGSASELGAALNLKP